MGRKKIKKYYLIDAINEKFGSVEKLAEKMGTTKQNLYSKIKTQSSNFMDELEEKGIVINEGDNIGASIFNNKGTASIGTNNNSGNNFQKEIEMLKILCESKDEIIKSLREQIELLKEK